MNISWKDLKVDFDYIDKNSILTSWKWLIGSDKTPILISSIGDIFLEDKVGACYWLNVGEGILEKVANTRTEFTLMLEDEEQVNEWFIPDLVNEIKKTGLELRERHLYSFKILPVLGGEYVPENFELTDIEVHLELSAQIHEQIKDLPDGTEIDNVINK